MPGTSGLQWGGSRPVTLLLPSSRVLHLLDMALALWVAVWIAFGVAIGVNVSHLATLSETVSKDGQAVETVAGSLHSLGSVPLIGGQISKDAEQVRQAGARAATNGQRSVSSIHVLSVLFAIAVALLPSVPVFGFYLPARLERRREAAALRRALRVHGADPDFQAFLARRAIEALGYHRLRRVSAAPWADGDDADRSALAAAELRRLGLDPRLLAPAQRSRS
jgi:hypothetical protein